LEVQRDMRSQANPEKAKVLSRFFKTGKGEYGEGDQFLGLTNPQCDTMARNYIALTIEQLRELLHSQYHEERLVALILLLRFHRKGNDKQKSDALNFYLTNTRFIN